MDYIEYLIKYVSEDIAEIIDEYIGPYCNICGRTFIKNTGVNLVHDGIYIYNECIDKSKCIILEKKTKYNPWSSTKSK